MSIRDKVFAGPVAIAWLGMVVSAVVTVWTATPIVFDLAIGGHPGRHSTHVLILLLSAVMIVSTILIQFLTQKAFGAGWLDEVIGSQMFSIQVGSLATYGISLFGPQAPLLTHVILIGLAVTSHFGFRMAALGYFSGRSPQLRAKAGAAGQTESPVEPARKLIPTITFKDIFGNEDIKTRLKDASQKITQPVQNNKSPSSADKPRNGILLFGEPGNGKTVFAEALAGELKLPLLQLSHSDVASQFIGQRSVYIKAAFAQAIKAAPCVFFIDEVDSFLESRDSSSQSNNKEDRDVVNALLTLMVDVRRHKVILMAATNHMDRLDGAGIREGRFDFKVEITPPDAAARIGLLNSGLKKNLPAVRIEQELIESVARRWNGFSVKRILAVTEELPSYLQHQGKPTTSVSYEDIMGALRAIQGRRGVVPENVKPLSELLLSPVTKDMIGQITGRLADPEYTERHGGTLPTGVLFYGPPGTGKTATAKALANEIQWAFLPVTGAEMSRDPKLLEKTFSKAKEIRPCLIFVDEADELLKSREYSASTEATNKLLTLMDGINDRVKDVVWIAATNNPEQIDPALLRSGRFTEKVMFELPSKTLLAQHVERWLTGRKIALSGGLAVKDVVDLIGEQSIANSEGILQSAVNRAVSRREKNVTVCREDVLRAVQSILG